VQKEEKKESSSVQDETSNVQDERSSVQKNKTISEQKDERTSESYKSETKTSSKQVDNSSQGVKELTGLGKDEVGTLTLLTSFLSDRHYFPEPITVLVRT
jgi:hypothetical protein